jgi:hypothetical protein
VSPRRFEVIGGPGGYLNIVAVGDPPLSRELEQEVA